MFPQQRHRRLESQQPRFYLDSRNEVVLLCTKPRVVERLQNWHGATYSIEAIRGLDSIDSS